MEASSICTRDIEVQIMKRTNQTNVTVRQGRKISKDHACGEILRRVPLLRMTNRGILKIGTLLLAFCLLSVACQPTPAEHVVVQKDTERLVDTVVNQNAAPTESVDPASLDPGFVKSDKHYTYDYASDNGRLTIHADADVYLPARGAISMARVRQENFTDEFIKKAFDIHFHGQTAYISNTKTYVPSKKEIAEDIAYYQELVDTGRTDEKLIDEEEALAYIEELKEQFKDAPDEAYTIDPPIADGSVVTREVFNGLDTTVSKEMSAFNDTGYLQISSISTQDGIPLYGFYTYTKGTPDTWISYSGSEECYTLSDWYQPCTNYKLLTEDAACAYGQSFSPADAVLQCKTYMEALDVTDILPWRECDAYIAKSGDTVHVMYVIRFVRTTAGSPTAFVPIIQGETGYDKYESPWPYETIEFYIDDTGIRICSWDQRVEPTKIISTDVQTIAYEEAIRIFENMCKITYEPKSKSGETVIYYDLYVNRIELSMLRVREQNSKEKTGLYVPTWVFYGKRIRQYNEHLDITPDRYQDVILFAINAVDGSIIDLSKGY